jgi:nucleotide-binding universal stress UspA family protein
MTQKDIDLEIKRILVALDASRHSRSALEAAIAMALRLQAELRGVFIEDPVVRRLAEADAGEEFGVYSGLRRSLDQRELSRQLRGQAGKVRRYFRFTTEQADIRCTYREVQGRVSEQVLSEAADCDVVILGKEAWSAVETGRLGPEVREVLSRLGSSALILRAGTHPRLPLLVIYDGSDQGDLALASARALAEGEKDRVVSVLLLAEDASSARSLRGRAEERLGPGEFEVSYRRMSAGNLNRLPALVNREGYHLVVIPDLRMDQEKMIDLLEDIKRPVLLIRQGA